MKKLVATYFILMFAMLVSGQVIDRAMLAKYSQRTEQEKIIEAQIVLLKMTVQQAARYKALSFYFIDKALSVVNANLNSSSFTLYRKMKQLKAEHESAMQSLLTPAQLEEWTADKKKNGLAAKLLKK